MTVIDWLIVVVVNGAIIGYGMRKASDTKTSFDWFLAARGLPWWVVGLSMFATAVDSGDYVAVAGASYQYGMSMITEWWIGLTLAWVICAYFVFLPMYRTAMFTNAEYLEYRFGTFTRTLSVLIQVQYRTNVLANVSYSLYLTFGILTGWDTWQTWILVVAIAAGAAIYTSMGGLRSVAITDSIQSLVMLAAAIVLWFTVWNHIGGWDALETRLDEVETNLSKTLLYVGGYSEPGAPPVLIAIGWILVLFAYCVVNHSQSMRMLASRSEWDMKMAALIASVITVLMMWFNITIGILGRAIFPDLEQGDQVYPQLISQFLTTGLIGIVVAGILAGGISTFDSIGSALAAVITRDLYARFLVPNQTDEHYLTLSKILTCLVIAVSFAYIPFLEGGMVEFYLNITRVAVMPLFTIYLMGALTRVHRRSGTVGLIVGIGFGLSAFLGNYLDLELPIWWSNKWWGYLWSLILPASSMVLYSICYGWIPKDATQGLVFSGSSLPKEGKETTIALTDTWIERTRKSVPQMPEYPFPIPEQGIPWYLKPHLWIFAFLSVMAFLNFYLFW